MITRWLRMLAYTGLLGCPIAGCNVYEPKLLGSVTAGRGGNSADEAGAADDVPDACVAALEICNDVDDDCNGVVDDESAASADCSFRYRAKVMCGRGGFCLFVGSDPMCDPGYFHCDGVPQNGCESPTPCCIGCATDAGEEDGGANDQR